MVTAEMLTQSSNNNFVFKYLFFLYCWLTVCIKHIIFLIQ